MTTYQIYVPDRKLSALVQEKLFELGWAWPGGERGDQRVCHAPGMAYVFALANGTLGWTCSETGHCACLFVEDLFAGKLRPFKKEQPKQFEAISVEDSLFRLYHKVIVYHKAIAIMIDGIEYPEEQVRAALKEFSECHATGSGNISWDCTASEWED